MMKRLRTTFGEIVNHMPKYRTQGTPNLQLSKPDDESQMVGDKDAGMLSDALVFGPRTLQHEHTS